jgi:hypothetical protein
MNFNIITQYFKKGHKMKAQWIGRVCPPTYSYFISENRAPQWINYMERSGGTAEDFVSIRD